MKKRLLIIFILLVILEATLFNINSYRLLFGDYNSKTYSTNDLEIVGMKYVGKNDTYFICSDEPYIEIKDINDEIATIKINIEYYIPEKLDYEKEGNIDNNDNSIPVQIYYTDDNSKEYRYLPKKELVNNIESSKYITCYMCGKSDNIRINIGKIDGKKVAKTNIVIDKENIHNDMYHQQIKINSIEINKKVPFKFNYIRVLVIYLIIVFLYVSLKSELFRQAYDEKNYKHKLIVIMILSLIIYATIFVGIIHNFTTYKDLYATYYTDAIINGQLNLIEKPSEYLEKLKNPYDETVRNKYLSDIEIEQDNKIQEIIEKDDLISNEQYKMIQNIEEQYTKRQQDLLIWDSTYYNGEYYVYFGILPALLFYVPFKLLTGIYLSHLAVILITSIISLIMLYKIIMYIYKKCFNNIPLNILSYSLIILLTGSMLFLLVGRPMFYEVIVSTGSMFAFIGFYYLLKMKLDEQIFKKDLIVAAICLSLSVACRPSYLFVSLLFIPILYNFIKNNVNNKKKIITTFLLISIPYLIVGIFLMYLNYIRFGSIFEFGYNYQLTVNNNGNIHYKCMSLPYVLFLYIFYPLTYISQFPFFEIQYNKVATFNGYMYCDGFFAGILWLQPITIILLFIFRIKKYIKETSKKQIIYETALLGLFYIMFNSIIGGINIRYYVDFSWLLVLSSIMIFWRLYNYFDNEIIRKIITKVMAYLAIISFIGNFVMMGLYGEQKVTESIRPTIYYNIRYSTCFWE